MSPNQKQRHQLSYINTVTTTTSFNQEARADRVQSKIHYNRAMMTCFLAWYYNNNRLATIIALQSTINTNNIS